ncbi:hypothetical protein NUW46_14965 [Marinobacter sp. MA]|uniref:hypothetical protein n=1 Tax=Marinobacter sp. MA TaxID=2971606 RepID=UPI003AB0F660
MTITAEQSQRWVWFIDVVFGAIVALGIQIYEPVAREAWSQGVSEFLLTIFVGISIFSFVVYDIAVYHALTNKFPFGMTSLSFLRFYLDLVMAFTLYLLMANAFQLHPDWVSIIAAVSFWHCAAVAWHLLARQEHDVVGGISSAVLPHVSFIAVYWTVAFVAAQIGEEIIGLDGTALSSLILIIVSTTILFISLFRWNQIIKKVAV